MSEHIITAMLVAAFATYFLYRRGQRPYRLTEMYNGLKAQADLASARSDTKNHLRFSDMADAIREAERILASDSLPSANAADLVRINLLRATDGDVLDALGIFDHNHRTDCYQSVMALAARFEKLQKKQVSGGSV